jgi:hypothetical protein
MCKLSAGVICHKIHITNSMEHNLSRETNSHSPSQAIPRLLWKQKFHYRAHNSTQLVPLLSQIYPIHTFPSYFAL